MTTTAALKDIHVFEALGHKLAFNGTTYDVALLDGIGFNVLSRSINGEALTGEDAVINEAICHDLMVSPQVRIQNSLDNERIISNHGIFVRSLCLNIASNCNMKCSYCFNNQGGYEFETHQAMSKETAQNAIDFLLTNCNGHCSVSFFGGEPLIYFPLIRETVIYAKKQARKQDKTISFHVTTNGTLITPKIARFLKQHAFSLIISLDGDEATHNCYRKSAQGSATYQTVLTGLKTLLDEYGSQDRITIRGTYTHQQMSFNHSFSHLVNEGFEHISIEPATGSEQNEYAVRMTDMPILAKEYEDLAKNYLKVRSKMPRVSFFHFAHLLENLTHLKVINRPCGAANGYMAVSPRGDLYPCHRIMSKQYKLGNVNETSCGGNLNEEIRRNFWVATTTNRPACYACWARNLCGGSCYAHNIDDGRNLGELDETGCELFKMRAELAIGLFVEEKLPDRNQNRSTITEHINIFRGEIANKVDYTYCEDSDEDTCDDNCENGWTCEYDCTFCEESCIAGGCMGSCMEGCEQSCMTIRMND